jgi:hypothetical protein
LASTKDVITADSTAATTAIGPIMLMGERVAAIEASSVGIIALPGLAPRAVNYPP